MDSSQLPHTVILQLLEPFYQVILKSEEKYICRKMETEIFDRLQTDFLDQLHSAELSDEQKGVIEDLVELLADRLFTLGAAKFVTKNPIRPLLYL